MLLRHAPLPLGYTGLFLATVRGIKPRRPARQASVLPLNYGAMKLFFCTGPLTRRADDASCHLRDIGHLTLVAHLAGFEPARPFGVRLTGGWVYQFPHR